jgi:hypothetical protein
VYKWVKEADAQRHRIQTRDLFETIQEGEP